MKKLLVLSTCLLVTGCDSAEETEAPSTLFEADDDGRGVDDGDKGAADACAEVEEGEGEFDPDQKETVPIQVLEIDGRQLNWIESGNIFLQTETGYGNVPSILKEFPEARNMLPTDQWTYLTGDAAPETLVGYEARYVASRQEQGARSQDPEPGFACVGGSEVPAEHGISVENRDAGCDENYFIANRCDSGDRAHYCKVDWWNGAYAYDTDAELHNSALCVQHGSAYYRLKINGAVVYYVYRAEGYWIEHSYIGPGGGCFPFICVENFSVRLDVTEASDSRFHWAFDTWDL